MAVALLVLVAGAPAYGQLVGDDDDVRSPGTTEPEPSEPPATEPPPSSEPSQPPPASSEEPGSEPEPTQPAPAEEAPPAGEAPPAEEGDSTVSQPTPGGIPPEAQAIIDSIPRSAANSSRALYEAVQRDLVGLGLSEEEAIRIGFGRFPIAGVATFVHDWYFPRWGPGFRFHMGTDVFAAHGTPVRSPVDGTVEAGEGSLGGLYVKVFQPDGTYFYMAHLSGLVEGFQDGMAVQTGDIVGYVGNSGNARTTPPHVHLGIYSAAGEATDPKPILDQMLADALATLPAVVEHVEANRPAAPAPAEVSAEPAPRVPRSLLAASLLRSLVDERAAGSLDTAVLLEAVGNPSSAGLAVAEAEASQLAASIDWSERAARTRTQRELVERVEEMFRSALGPLR